MELREFAERVLFGTSLEEKLQCPADITDENPGAFLVTPESPGRPENLRFKQHRTGKAEVPAMHHLEQARERGRLLHFFANHELLATELMALVLLKFPDAPAAFRKGVLQTLKDEQEHTRLYLERMKACGIEFGELPVSGYFWRCVAPMENPIDYVAGLCLTFEQANLDFARHFARGFESVGDQATAQLLGKIYRDEIAHVAYGLKWFRRWKNPSESDWEAFCHTLKFPLSPQRAKGFSLNVEGRRSAGFDPNFIAELNVYSQSKGRTPSVFVFNPFAEARIAWGKSFNPTRHQVQLAQDLENLPQFLCRQDDVVLVDQRPSVEFLSGIKQAGFALPEFVELKDGSLSAQLGFETEGNVKLSRNLPAAGHRPALRKLGRLRPWAWSPDSVELLSPIFPNVTAENRSPEQRFNNKLAQLYSKSWSAHFLQSFLGHNPAHAKTDWLCSENEIGVPVKSLADALDATAEIRKRGHHKIVVKQTIGLAGSNAMRLFEPAVLESHRRWIENSLEGGHELIVEPWLERLVDFSVQLEMTGGGLKVCGYTELLNDAKGQYQGNIAEPHYHTRIPATAVAPFGKAGNVSGRILAFYAELFEVLENELRRVDFSGPLGIDAFVYRDASGAARLKPIVEINPRYTMGRVAVELMRQVCQGSSGCFRLVNRASLQAEGCEDFPVFTRKLGERFPLITEGEDAPRIREGAVCLNDLTRAQGCLAVFQVSRQPGIFIR